METTDSDDEFNDGAILPTLLKSLIGILERYPDDEQIIKVFNVIQS